MGHTDPDIELEIPGHLEDCRIDKGLAELLPGYSRSSIQKWLKSGNVTDDGKSCKQSDKLRGNELLTVVIPATEPAKWVAQEMPLEVLYKDTDILVISNQQNGVHPEQESRWHTVKWLLSLKHRCDSASRRHCASPG